jgi:hypothetical protein
MASNPYLYLHVFLRRTESERGHLISGFLIAAYGGKMPKTGARTWLKARRLGPKQLQRGRGPSVFFQILLGDVVFGHLARMNLALVRVISVFNTLHHFRFKGVSFFQKLIHAFGVRRLSSR